MVVREIFPNEKKREYVCKTLLYTVTVLVPLSANPIFVPENICFVREEDLTFPKGDRSQPEKHRPHHAHQDGHHGVHDKEARDLQRVAEHAETRNPTDIRERQGPAYTTRTQKNAQKKKSATGRRNEKWGWALTSKDLAEVLVDFEPVREQAKREEEDGKTEKEKSDEHARGEPDLAGQRRDEIVLRKAV